MMNADNKAHDSKRNGRYRNHDAPIGNQRWSIAGAVLVFLNVTFTWLTIVVELKESPLIAWATGRHDTVRQRLLTGAISTDIIEDEHFRIEDLASPKQLADYRFLWTPRRDPSNVGDSRSVCLNINTNSAPVMMNRFNDFWGKGSRRVQIYTNSISASRCQVLNVRPAWRDQCVAMNQGNATLCHQYVLDNFDALRANRIIRTSVQKDIGAAGVPFLRCLGRPLVPFKFKADLLAHQTYWSGGDYHVTIQTSNCRGLPLAQTNDQKFSLFQTINMDEACDMLVLLPPGGWLAFIVPWIYSFVTLALVTKGIVQALFRTSSVSYLPHGLRIGKHRRWLRYALPFMDLTIKISDQDRSIVTFKGSMLIASDVWVTHWLFMWLSILDAVINLRGTYVILQIAETLLSFKVTAGNLVFLCGALVKITWLMCLAQTIVRFMIKIGARCLRSVRLIRSTTREKLEWNIDGISILLSYRMYYVMLFVLMVILLGVKGDPSFMVKDVPYKVGAFGGVEDLAGFWGSEVACDLVTLLGLLVVVSLAVGTVLMHTKYQQIADNNVMRLLQNRYVVSGWDGLLAAHMLGLDPSDDDFSVEGHAYTKFSIGSLLQLLYLSGPSGLVHFGGDYIFHDNGFSMDPVRFRYPISKALAMGLFSTGAGSVMSSSHPATAINASHGSHAPSTTGSSVANSVQRPTRETLAAAQVAKRSIFERRLRLVSESYLGKMLLIDATQPGQLVTSHETGRREYEVVDALTTMAILDIKHLMGREKQIRVM